MKLLCDIQVPASKSESNRAQMIAAYGGFFPDFQNVSDSNDTRILANAISQIQNGKRVIDIADCGTAARFLTTFLACRSGNWLLTGTERMKQRPIKPLVEALGILGAKIQYAEKEGFMPLIIEGKPRSGGKVQIDMGQSSQFASSLLLAAPMWPQGIELELHGEQASVPYLEMTIALMRHFGAEVEQNGRTIMVKPKPYQPTSFKVSADWSAASYWYEMAALSEECEIRLSSLSLEPFERSKDRPTLQGDAIVAEWMKSLGVNTMEDGDSLVLTKMPFEHKPFHFDFSSCPDLFPTMAATCAGLQLEARFSGIRNLHFKESDRVGAMRMELAKIGVELMRMNDNEVLLKPAPSFPFFEESTPLQFASHDDHRIVMALAPLALRLGSIVFDRPEMVEKSYPTFWTDVSFLMF